MSCIRTCFRTVDNLGLHFFEVKLVGRHVPAVIHMVKLLTLTSQLLKRTLLHLPSLWVIRLVRPSHRPRGVVLHWGHAGGEFNMEDCGVNSITARVILCEIIEINHSGLQCCLTGASASLGGDPHCWPLSFHSLSFPKDTVEDFTLTMILVCPGMIYRLTQEIPLHCDILHNIYGDTLAILHLWRQGFSLCFKQLTVTHTHKHTDL